MDIDRKYKLTAQGDCPACRAPIPGRWSKKFDGQIASLAFSAPQARR
jgi:hypothetical protein